MRSDWEGPLIDLLPNKSMKFHGVCGDMNVLFVRSRLNRLPLRHADVFSFFSEKNKETGVMLKQINEWFKGIKNKRVARLREQIEDSILKANWSTRTAMNRNKKKKWTGAKRVRWWKLNFDKIWKVFQRGPSWGAGEKKINQNDKL